MSWPVERSRSDAAAFHARALPDPVERGVWVCDPLRPALVLGSAQHEDVVDAVACARAGVDVVRRRSGGGAVLVASGAVLWVDVLVPAGDPLWEPDVGRAFLWLGATWADALADLGVEASVHGGPLLRNRWSDLVCFAGLGPGELTDGAGRKVLGISQRRTRAGARFQCALLGAWTPRALLGLLALSADDRGSALADLEQAAAPAGAPLEAVLAAFLQRLP